MRQTSRQPTLSPGNRLAFVTGANRGLGQALSLLLEEKGFSVRKIDRSFTDLARSTAPLVDLIRQETPDLLINNAGFGLYGDACNLSVQEQIEMIDVNCKAVVELTLEAAKALKAAKKKGTIVNIASAGAFFSFPSFATYAATKGFVNQWSLAVDQELKPYGIRVLSSCPGQIATDFRKKASKGFSEKHDLWTMTSEKAAKCVWRQIERGKPEYIFTWPYRLGVSISKLLPKSVLHKLLRPSIQKRFPGGDT